MRKLGIALRLCVPRNRNCPDLTGIASYSSGKRAQALSVAVSSTVEIQSEAVDGQAEDQTKETKSPEDRAGDDVDR